MENYIVCNCMKVTYSDIYDELLKNKNFSDVTDAFEKIKAVTKCSSGCGGCHDKVLDIISEIMMR